MIKHYFKIAFRNLAKQKVLSGINILGLSIGLACFILFLLYAVNEFTFDRFHKNADNVSGFTGGQKLWEKKKQVEIYQRLCH